ncbi:MAG TPA: lactonase family protein [Chloroflexia bacterium]|nr:lactonase family protein [Chloroflexia bacterium]
MNTTNTLIAYVGCYTSEAMKGKGEGLAVYRVDSVSGDWSRIQCIQEVVDPSFLVLDRAGRFLYCVEESIERVSAFAIEPESGRLTLLNRQPSGGSTPAALVLDPQDRFLITANYMGGPLAVMAVEADGRLDEACQLLEVEGKCGPDPVEQTCSHPHDVRFDPSGKYLLVPDKGFDRVFVYRRETESGLFTPNQPAFAEEKPGAGPRHIAFHPNDHYCYLINELNSTVSVFKFDPQHGTMEALQVISTLPPGFSGNNTCAEITVAPSGKFVYGSNRGHDSIVVYAVDESSGTLSIVDWTASGGKTPRFFTLNPDGNLLVVAHQDSDNIVTFQVDQASGKLTPTGQDITTGSPVCIGWKAL